MILTLIPIYTFLFDAFIAAVFGCLVTYFLKLRAEKVNRSINELILNNRLIGHQISTTLKPFIYEHNRVCVQLSNYDKFWSKLYFYLVFTIIPINLCFLHQFLFEDIELHIKFLIGLTLIIQLSLIFIFQFIVASLSDKIHKSGKRLSRLQWGINGWPFRARIKIKLLTCFERLSSNRKIGFTIGSLTVMTYPLFYKVINFCFSYLFTYFQIQNFDNVFLFYS
jgi:hypothetical protein